MTQTTEELESSYVKLPTDANQLLADVLKHRGWDMREGQVTMVEAIHDSMQDDDGSAVDVAVNAPVGTGKTLAYILAALAMGKRIIIATSTKSLQDQIVGDELPELAQDLQDIYGYKLDFSVLKGMSNYPCSTAIHRALDPKTPDSEDEGLFEDVDFGDVNEHEPVLRRFLEMSEVAAGDPELLDRMILESETLLEGIPLNQRAKYSAGGRCFSKRKPYRLPDEVLEESISPNNALIRAIHEPHVCLYRSAYARCISSQIVVVNTALLVAEIRKADQTMMGSLDPQPSILNGCGVVVVDEAHHASRIISEAYSQRIEFDDLYKEVRLIGKRINKDAETKENPYTQLYDAIEMIEDQMIDAIDHADTEEDLQKRLQRGFSQLKEMCLETSSQTRNEWSGKASISKKTMATISKFNDTFVVGNAPLANFASLIGTTNRDGGYANHLEFEGGDDDRALVVDAVPIDVSWFRSKVSRSTQEANFWLEGTRFSYPEKPACVVLSSGTITAQTAVSIGVKATNFLNVPSPFDSRKVRMYVPRNIAAPPQRDAWIRDAVQVSLEAIQEVGGRTLVLTTSNSMVDEFTNALSRVLPEEGIEVMSQREGSKRALISRFKENERSVLVATMGFWEGVDVPGQALSQVIMDKIPFPSKSAVIEARKQFFKERGENEFVKVDVDMAAIMLAQGAGRVIRSVNDVGACMVLDHRIVSKQYSDKVSSLLPRDWYISENKEAYLEWLRWVNPDTRSGPMPEPDPEEWRTIGRPRVGRGRIRGGMRG